MYFVVLVEKFALVQSFAYNQSLRFLDVNVQLVRSLQIKNLFLKLLLMEIKPTLIFRFLYFYMFFGYTYRPVTKLN